jgi:TRAP-type mannitol/chloroaromatic compound transport system permease large subunit
MGVVERGTTYRDVVMGATPYIICNLILFGLLLAFPALALYLPSLIAS